MTTTMTMMTTSPPRGMSDDGARQCDVPRPLRTVADGCVRSPEGRHDPRPGLLRLGRRWQPLSRPARWDRRQCAGPWAPGCGRCAVPAGRVPDSCVQPVSYTHLTLPTIYSV